MENLEGRQLLTLVTHVVEVPISAAAIQADPNLANYKTLDLQVTVDPGEKWISADMKAVLTAGSFYNTAGNRGGSTVPVKQFWGSFPDAEFDTYVSKSAFERPVVLGEYQPTIGNGGVFKAQETNVSWGSLPPDEGTGTFTIARLTVTKDANGTIVGQDASSTTPSFQPKAFQFNIVNGSVQTLSSISGRVFDDTNGNGKDDSDSGIANIKVYYDKNNNGKFDSGEKYRMTAADGSYSFDALTAGTYYIRQTTPTGYRRTTSTSKYTVVLSKGVNGTGKNFGLTTTALLSGTVFNDKNSNGKKDSGESGVSGFNVFLDSNNNGKLDTGEKFAGSDSNGYWVFKALKPGTYQVRIQSKTGYKTVGTSSFSLKAGSGGSYTGRLFAEHKIA